MVAAKKIDRIISEDGDQFIDLIQRDDGLIFLERYVRKYDPEEEVHYEIKVSPNPDGLFSERSAAATEAERLLS